jgi:hypothetical protein
LGKNKIAKLEVIFVHPSAVILLTCDRGLEFELVEATQDPCIAVQSYYETRRARGARGLARAVPESQWREESGRARSECKSSRRDHSAFVVTDEAVGDIEDARPE